MAIKVNRRELIFRCEPRKARNIPALGKKFAWPKRNKICSSFIAFVF
jgi:hypothetical protein